jgi:hypothetical protein
MVRLSSAAALLAAATVSALALSSCGGGPDLQDWPAPPEPTLGLPDGAVLGNTDLDPQPGDSGGAPWGSLRPDDATADERVPDIVGAGAAHRGCLAVDERTGLPRPGHRRHGRFRGRHRP